MGQKRQGKNLKKEEEQNDDGDFQDIDSDDEGSEVDIEEEVQKKIKELPNLKDKVQAIAINSYLIEKRQIDKQMVYQTDTLQQDFRARFKPYIQEMNKIINGEYKFTDADFQQCGELLTEEQMSKKDELLSPEKIPQYWLKVFLNSDILSEQVQQRDEPLLKYLEKVQTFKEKDLSKLTIDFFFSENEWFSNTKLSKHFNIKDGEITKSYGDKINWKQGKNITQKVVKAKKGKKAKKAKIVREKSFFNFFREVDADASVDIASGSQFDDDDQIEELQLHNQMATTLYQDLVPKSIEYYLNVVGDTQPETPKAQLQTVEQDNSQA